MKTRIYAAPAVKGLSVGNQVIFQRFKCMHVVLMHRQGLQCYYMVCDMI